MDQKIPAEPHDEVLVRRAKSGDLSAFEALAARYERQVYTLALRIVRHEQDAEDVTQQTFLSAMENLGGFREAAPFPSWLFRIAAHAALKVLRKAKGLATFSLDEAMEPQEGSDRLPHPDFIADWRQSPEELIQRNEIRKLLEEALQQLDEKHRLVFLLRDVEGLSIKETAEALGLTEGNTKVRLLRARLQLRERLTKSFGDPDRRIAAGHHHPG